MMVRHIFIWFSIHIYIFQGNKIHATVKEDLVDYFELLLLEGDSKIIVNFSLSEACGFYRSTKHPYKIVFNATTRVRYCDDLPYRLTGFQPVNFREILDGRLSPEYLVGECCINRVIHFFILYNLICYKIMLILSFI